MSLYDYNPLFADMDSRGGVQEALEKEISKISNNLTQNSQKNLNKICKIMGFSLHHKTWTRKNVKNLYFYNMYIEYCLI